MPKLRKCFGKPEPRFFFFFVSASSAIPILLCLGDIFKSPVQFWTGLLVSHLETGG